MDRIAAPATGTKNSARPNPTHAIFAAGREQARKMRRNMIAPLRVIDAVEAAATLPFEEGCKRNAKSSTNAWQQTKRAR